MSGLKLQRMGLIISYRRGVSLTRLKQRCSSYVRQIIPKSLNKST
jgi:hypothetical protein